MTRDELLLRLNDAAEASEPVYVQFSSQGGLLCNGGFIENMYAMGRRRDGPEHEQSIESKLHALLGDDPSEELARTVDRLGMTVADWKASIYVVNPVGDNVAGILIVPQFERIEQHDDDELLVICAWLNETEDEYMRFTFGH